MSIDRHYPSSAVIICLALGGLLTCAVDAAADLPGKAPLVYAKWETFTTQNGLPDNSIRVIRAVDGAVWVGTEGGLALYDGRNWKSWTQSDGMASPVVTAIDVDTITGDVWLGLWGRGLARFSAGRFDTFDQFNSGLAGDLVFAVRFSRGRVWAATNGGVSLFDPTKDTWDLYAGRTAKGPETAFTSLNMIGDDLYLTGWGTGVQRFDPVDESWFSFDGPAGLVDSHGDRRALKTIFGSTSTGQSLRLLTQDTLFHRSGSEPWGAHSLLTDGGASRFARCLASPNESQEWVGTSDGVHVLVDADSDSWLSYRRDERDGYDGSITLSRKGRTIATRLTETAIPNNRIRCIDFEPVRTTSDPGAARSDPTTARDANGPVNGRSVWVGTIDGLTRGSELSLWDDLPDAAAKTVSRSPSDVNPARDMRAARTRVPNVHESEETPSNGIAIGLLGPRARPIPVPGGSARFTGEPGRPDLLAVQLALEYANAHGRHPDRRPFRLVTGVGRYQRYGWGNPDDDFATFLYSDHAFGIVGYLNPDGVIRNAVAWTTEVPFVNVAETTGADRGAVAENPWAFRCFGDEPRRHRLLLDHLFDQRGLTRVAALRIYGPVAGPRLDWYADHARSRGLPLVADLSCALDQAALGSALEVLRTHDPEVVLTSCDRQASVAVLLKMREMGMNQLFVGSTDIVSKGFIESAGAHAGEVIALSPGQPLMGTGALPDFAKQYTEHNLIGNVATPPSPGAYRSFDATDHLVEAIKTAGPDREAVREVLERMSRSSTGEMHYERTYKPVKPMLARLEEGRWIFQTIP